MTLRSPGRSWGAVAVSLAAMACGGRSDDAAESLPVAERDQIVTVANPGVIRGTVLVAGTVPPARPVAVGEGDTACGRERTVAAVEVGPNGGLANAVVSLVDVRRGGAPPSPASEAVLDQRGCDFVPHVVIVPAGAPVSVHNSDPVTHNVHTVTFENRPTNRSQPAGAGPIALTFPAAERVRVQCDMHGWMSAWIVVVDHPYYATTDDTGRFVLPNVPPGTYTLEVWHETLGSRRDTVTVAPRDTTDFHTALHAPG